MIMKLHGRSNQRIPNYELGTCVQISLIKEPNVYSQFHVFLVYLSVYILIVFWRKDIVSLLISADTEEVGFHFQISRSIKTRKGALFRNLATMLLRLRNRFAGQFFSKL